MYPIQKSRQIKATTLFLVNELEFLKTLKSFIDSMYEKFKNEKRI